ncbi:MAG: uracil-DNA glycosylase family protein [Pseudomonadota bacterium]
MSATARPALRPVVSKIRACTVCRDAPAGPELPHPPRPIFQISKTATVAICSQAPGNRAHVAGKPFYDPSGVRLRDWLNLDEATFYDARRVAIIPMGFCFPGYDKHGGDLPPRKECVATWHDQLFSALPRLRLRLCIGKYSLAYHLPETRHQSLTDTVKDWRGILERTEPHPVMALPHPSWRNNHWLHKNPWFETELLPVLRARVAAAVI